MTEEYILKIAEREGIPIEELEEKLRHFESFGLDGQAFRAYRGWELTDDECLVLKEELAKREDVIRKKQEDMAAIISRKTGINKEEILAKYHLAKECGYKSYWFAIDGIYLLSDEEIRNHKNMRDVGYGEDLQEENEQRLKKLSKKIRNKTEWNKAQYRLEFLKARNNCECAADEYSVYRIWKKSPEDAREMLTAGIKHRIWFCNASTYEKSILFRNKVLFSEACSDFMNRVTFSTDGLTYEDFTEKIKGLDKIVYKLAEGNKGIGFESFDVNGSEEQNREVYEHIRGLEPGIIEEYIRQHPAIASFYPDAVNTLRVVTAIGYGEAKVIMAALRTGTDGSIDNWSQGGISAGVNIETGIIETEGVDYNGKKHAIHPIGGVVFRGFRIPDWNEVVSCCCKAAERFPDFPFIGWDVSVLEDGRVALIEGNPDFGIKAIQTPYARAGVGLRDRVEQYIELAKG